MMTTFEWLDDKTLVILGVLGVTAVMAVFSPELISQHLDAILAGLFGIVVGTAKK